MADKTLLDYVNAGTFPNIKPRRFAVEIGKAMLKGGELHRIAYPLDTGLKVENGKLVPVTDNTKQFHDYGILSDKESVFLDWAEKLNGKTRGAVTRKTPEQVRELMLKDADEYDKYLESLRSASSKKESNTRMDWATAHATYSPLLESDDEQAIADAIETLESHNSGPTGWRRDNKTKATELIKQLNGRLDSLSER